MRSGASLQTREARLSSELYFIIFVIMCFLYFSEMFMDTNKFSTKTLSAINNLEGAVIRKKQEYNWRKEMEE